MKNYKNGLPPPLEKANLSGGWRRLGKGVTPKKICKKNGGGLCFQDTQANWSTQFDSCFFLCKATKLNYMEAFLISAANIGFPSFHFWSTNERCAFLLLIRNDTIHALWRTMCSARVCLFFLAYSYTLCMGWRSQRVICARTKNVCFTAWVFPLEAGAVTYLSCLLSFYRTN